jgi:hypothetical protein
MVWTKLFQENLDAGILFSKQPISDLLSVEARDI